MKKLIAIIAFAAICASSLAQVTNVEMKADSATIGVNDTIWIPITVKNYRLITALTGTLSWDSTVVKLESYRDLLYQPQGTTVIDTSMASSGHLTWNWSSMISIGPSLQNGDTLFLLKYRGLMNGSATDLAFNSSLRALFWRGGNLGNSGPIDSVNGHIQIGRCINPKSAFGYMGNGFNYTFSDSSSNNPTSWLWDFGDGNTDTARNPTHSYAMANTYNVCLITTNDCGQDTLCKSITVSASSIDKLLRTQFSIFPNPANEYIEIQNVSGLKTTVFIYDAKGRMIMNKNLPESYMRLELGTLENGFYSIEFRTSDSVIKKKFIKN